MKLTSKSQLVAENIVDERILLAVNEWLYHESLDAVLLKQLQKCYENSEDPEECIDDFVSMYLNTSSLRSYLADAFENILDSVEIKVTVGFRNDC